jgi:hypothetical protein
MMRSGNRIAIGLASILTATLNFTACGSTSHDSMVAGGGSSATGAGDGTSASSNGASSNGGTSSINTNSGGSSALIGAGGIGDSCAAHVSTAKLVPLDLYIMLDTSGSMLEVTATNVSKWDAIKSAIETFLNDSASAGLGVGLQYFPISKPNAPTSCNSDAQCTGDTGPCFLKWCYAAAADPQLGVVACERDSDCLPYDGGPCSTVAMCSKNAQWICPTPGAACGNDPMTGMALGTCTAMPPSVCEHTATCDIPTYAAPAVAIATLPGVAPAITKSIDAQMPDGTTPTGPALTGAIQQATAWAKAHPDHRVVTLLATDGLPTECTPTDINQVGAIAAQAVAATPSIDTFVIGVFGTQDVMDGAPANLDTIAQDGGTTSAFIVDTTKDVTAQFLAALDAIRGGKLDCSFQIPQPDDGQTLNYEQVNVQVSSTGQPDALLYYVGSVDKCDAKTGGWYYDTDPGVTAPSKIITCPASCSAFQAATDASVEIALGCQTVVK